jgi:hypothetical protein
LLMLSAHTALVISSFGPAGQESMVCWLLLLIPLLQADLQLLGLELPN